MAAARTMIWRHVREVLGLPGCGRRARAQLVFLFLTRFHRRGVQRVDWRGGALFFDRRTLDSDWATFREIFVPRVRDYPSDFGGCVVVDLGAHKGYFGLSAVLGGAREVISYEPAAANFALLERTARPFPRWTVHRAAVSTTSGRGVLTLSEESWTHSLRNVADPVGSEEVTLVGIGEVIRERACVKVDIEGLERAVLESGDWSTVDAVWVEVHDEADRVPIEAVLEHAGLERDDSPAGSRVLGFRRP